MLVPALSLTHLSLPLQSGLQRIPAVDQTTSSTTELIVSKCKRGARVIVAGPRVQWTHLFVFLATYLASLYTSPGSVLEWRLEADSNTPILSKIFCFLASWNWPSDQFLMSPNQRLLILHTLTSRERVQNEETLIRRHQRLVRRSIPTRPIFTAQRYASAIYAFPLCLSDRPFICLSQVGVLSKQRIFIYLLTCLFIYLLHLSYNANHAAS